MVSFSIMFSLHLLRVYALVELEKFYDCYAFDKFFEPIIS